MYPPQYLPDRCHSCDYWTLHEVVFVSGGANFICSHCNGTIFMKGTERTIKIHLARVRKIFPHLVGQNAALLNLQKPGDHVTFSKKSKRTVLQEINSL